MDMYKKAKVNSTPAVNPVPNDVPAAGGGGMNASIAPLITMIAVLAIILIFCFCGAPAVRAFCRKRVCCCCPLPDVESPVAREDEDFVVLTALQTSKNGEVPQTTAHPPRQ